MPIPWIIGIYLLLFPLISRLNRFRAQEVADRRYRSWVEEAKRTGDDELFAKRMQGLSSGFLTAGELAAIKYENIAYLFIFIMLFNILPFFAVHINKYLVLSFAIAWVFHTVTVGSMIRRYFDRE